MNFAKKFSVALGILFFTVGSFASNFGVLAGVNSTTADIENRSTERELRYQVGGVFLMDFTDKAFFRTGAIVAQRYFSYEDDTNNFEQNYEFSYLAFPSTILFEMTDVFYLFGGFNILANMSDACSFQPVQAASCEATDVEKILIQPVVGVQLAFNEEMRFEIFYEHGIGNVADGVKNMSTLGFNYLFLTY